MILIYDINIINTKNISDENFHKQKLLQILKCKRNLNNVLVSYLILIDLQKLIYE